MSDSPARITTVHEFEDISADDDDDHTSDDETGQDEARDLTGDSEHASHSDEEVAEETGFVPPTHVFFENEPLIRALNDPRRGENDPELAGRLFSALMDATLIALIPEEQELGVSDDGELILEGEIELSFVLVRHPDVDGDIVPLFTDEGALSSFTEDGGRYVALAVRDLFPLLGSGASGAPNIVVNPGGDEALLLTPRMVQDIIDAARGYGTRVIDDSVEVTAAPAEDPMPADALAAVSTLLREHEAVVRCTEIQWFMADRHDEPSLVLVVELDDDLVGEQRKFALAHLWRELSPVLRTLERQIEMVDYAAQRERLAGVIENIVPFYVRDT